MGPLPPERNAERYADPMQVKEFEQAIGAIAPPLSNEEAEELTAAFGDDDCFGLAWSLLHLIETAPELPVKAEPPSDANEWIRRIWYRAHR